MRSLGKNPLVNFVEPDAAAAFQLAGAIAAQPAAPALPSPLPSPPDVPLSYLSDISRQIYAPSLTRDDQLTITAKLREAVTDPDDFDTAVKLARLLEKREDLYAVTERQLRDILQLPSPRRGSLALSKGGDVSFAKQAPGLVAVAVGLGWDAPSDFDLDACALACKADGKVWSDQYFVFFNNPKSPDGSIEHLGDGRDHEQINITLPAIPSDIVKIVFIVAIYDAESRRQSFEHVRSAFIRVVDRTDGQELARYELPEGTLSGSAAVFGELYRYGREWRFRAVGQGYSTGLRGIALDFGVSV